ncbi:MAG: class I SAM-dependent methyltransferase [Candidatus Promineofilum sp.]|nr:class I SAM-dependent methyltransferase [Promineifilum sp.]
MITKYSPTAPQPDTSHLPFGMPPITGELRRISQLVGQGEVRTGLNRARSAAANVWTFRVRAAADGAHCPCCGWRGPGFVSLSNWRAVQHHSRCPRCDSRSRHRGLASLIPTLLSGVPAGPVLVFAPEPALMAHIIANSSGPVHTTDYLRPDVDFPGEDIQRLTFADAGYAALFCNHVLEHIPDDRAALRECARVLQPGGVAVFTIPGDYDQPITRTFDQPDANGHLRHYGLDVLEKMRDAFDRAEAVDMSIGMDPRRHIHPGDLAFVCRT